MTLRKLAKLLISTVLTLLALEGLVRWKNVDGRRMGDPFKDAPVLFRMWTPDAFLQWRNRPSVPLLFTRVVLNAQGHRGPEMSPRKAPGVRRVAVLGDSCTFGLVYTAPDHFETPRPYAEVLQEMLDRKAGPGRFEVINYGTIGYTSYNGLRQLRRDVLRDHPDFVVIRFGWNDHLASAAGHPFSNVRNPWLERLEDLAYRSRLYAMIQYRGNPYEGAERIREMRSAHPVVWVTPDDYAWNLSRMIDLARAHGARPILLDAPPAPLTAEIRKNRTYLEGTGYETFEQLLAAHARYQDITARVAREKGVPFVRTQAPPEEAAAYFSPYDLPHPNEAGHERIARILSAEILSLAAREHAP